MGVEGERSGREIVDSLPVHPLAAERPRMGSLKAAIAAVSIPGDFAEFGVYRGRGANMIESLMTGKRKLHLFDSFEGLPENWTKNKVAGTFRLAAGEIPEFDSERVLVHKGWFKDTVPVWGQKATVPLAFVHLDADLYSSTIDALFNIDHLLLRDTILLFDEYVMGRTDHEHRALLDWAAKFSRQYEYLWRSRGTQVCVRVC